MPKPKKAKMRSCHDGKLRYETRELALKALNAMLARKALKGVPVVSVLRVYGCACGGFHYGRVKGGVINWSVVNNYVPPPPKGKRSPSSRATAAGAATAAVAG